MLLGAHMSISGGIFNAPIRGESIGCDTIQIFTKNANQWKAKTLTDDEIKKFQDEKKRTGIHPIFGHDGYLINIAAPSGETYAKSMVSLLEEVERAERLSLPYLVMHPGSHLGSGEEEGLKKIASSINEIHKKTKGYKVKITVETTAGQGSNLGYRFEQIARIMDMVKESERLAVCYDTCHTFAAGYDIRDKKAYKKTFDEFDEVIGLDRLAVFHLNDSKRELASRIDRHEHIGKGCIGLEAFRILLNDKRFAKIPMVLETPKGPDMAEDIENLEVLRSLIKK